MLIDAKYIARRAFPQEGNHKKICWWACERLNDRKKLSSDCHIEDMHSERVFPKTWPSMRYTLLFNLLTLLTPLASPDNAHGVT